MEPQHIDELSEILARLRCRLGEVTRQSDPFAGIVLDQIAEHVNAADALICRLVNAQSRTVPTINPTGVCDLVSFTNELIGGISDRAQKIVDSVTRQMEKTS